MSFLIFFKKNAHLGKIFTVNHYLNEGISRRSIYHILKTCEERNSSLKKPGSGLSKASTAAVVRNNTNKKGVSLRQLSKKYNVSATTMCRMFKRSNVKCYMSPSYSADQLRRIKLNCKKLLRTFPGMMSHILS